jgi:prepilin-type N-terminal cleavage/methylation domain-containing protein/prepilin-type processing-associated H-X9-DG protein
MNLLLSPACFAKHRSKKRAMTLIELLVVIAVVGLLAAILLPSLARAKGYAQRTVCINNLKQWALAMQIYTAENEDFLPRESATTPGTSRNLWTAVKSAATSDVWYNTLPPHMATPTASNYFYMRPAFYERSSLFQCPSAKIKPDTAGFALFAVSMNSKLIKLGLPLNVSDLCEPASTVMFLDNLLDGESTVVQGPTLLNLGQPSSYANRFSARHNDRGNLVFWDSHTESLTGPEVVDIQPGPNYGRAIEPQKRIIWDPCPGPY